MIICKLYLEKAYDYVNWNSLLYLQRRFGLRKKFRTWTNMYFFIHIFSSLEWQPCRFFGEFERVTTGDTLSSLFFILVMELPCKVIDMAAEEGCLMGLIVEGSNRNALTMPYIFCTS